MCRKAETYVTVDGPIIIATNVEDLDRCKHTITVHSTGAACDKRCLPMCGGTAVAKPGISLSEHGVLRSGLKPHWRSSIAVRALKTRSQQRAHAIWVWSEQ